MSLGRWYGEHGSAFWDHINYGPGGRPNLQGPALHFAIGVLGRALGGSGDAYVLANALLAVLQWAAAMFTAAWFARLVSAALVREDWVGWTTPALLLGAISPVALDRHHAPALAGDDLAEFRLDHISVGALGDQGRK